MQMNTSPKPTLVDYLHLHFLVVIWGFTAILGKLINADLSRVSLTFFRTLLAAVGLALVLTVRKEWKKVAPQDRNKLLGVGVIMGVHWLTFFASAHMSSASVCLAGMSTTSLFTALLEPLFSRKQVRPLEILMSLLVMLGLYLIFRFEFDQSWGLGLALISSLLAALFGLPAMSAPCGSSSDGLAMARDFGQCVYCLRIFGRSAFVEKNVSVYP